MLRREHILKYLDVSFYQNLIPSLRENGKGEAVGLCLFHDDHHSSLSVNVETGLYHCFACGAGGDIFTFYQNLKSVDFPTALEEMAEMVGIKDTTPSRKIVATFQYQDVEGRLLYLKERIEPGRNGRSKEFIMKHQEQGQWVLGRGCNPVLYNLLFKTWMTLSDF